MINSVGVTTTLAGNNYIHLSKPLKAHRIFKGLDTGADIRSILPDLGGGKKYRF